LISICFALAPAWDEFDDDDFSLLEGNTISWITRDLFFVSLSLGFELGVFATILRLEYLTSHIGEKRPADLIIKLTSSLIQARFAMTALLNSAVILFSGSFPHGVMRQTYVSRSILMYPISSQENFLFQEVVKLCVKPFHQICSVKNF